MAEPFVEIGAEAVHHIADKYWDDIHGFVTGNPPAPPPPSSLKAKARSPRRQADDTRSEQRSIINNNNSKKGNSSDNNSTTHRSRRRRVVQLPSPERERGAPRSDSLERESRTTDTVTIAYENERDDPVRKPDPQLESQRQRGPYANMSAYQNDYAPAGTRTQQAPPPRGRYYDDDGDSDYDEHDGRRYRASGRGYDDRDDRDYEREVTETERYRGPARDMPPRRESYGTRSAHDGPYGAGAMAPYRRSANDVTETATSRRRSRSRARTDKYDRDYDDRDYDRDYDDRDRERGGGGGGWRDKLDGTFDTSLKGLGAGLAGAVIGGLAGREFGSHSKHKDRDVLLGAVIGGLGANIAENKWREYREDRRDKTDRDEERWEQKWDGRSRSSLR